MIEAKNRFDLYQEFARNKGRSSFRRVAPAIADGILVAPSAVLTAVKPELLEKLAENPLGTATLIALSTSMGIASIGVVAEYFDMTRVSSPNGKIAQEIAQLEGRNSRTHSEKVREIKRVKHIVKTARIVGPTATNIANLEVERLIARIRSRKNPAIAEEKAIQDRKYRKLLADVVKRDEIGYPQDPEVLTTVYILADKQWAELVDNPNVLEHRRHYGRLMQDEIRKKLGDHLGTPAKPALEQKTAEAEAVKQKKLRSALQTFVSRFPIDDLEIRRQQQEALNEQLKNDEISPVEWFRGWNNLVGDRDQFNKVWEHREDSEEKRALFEEIRQLLFYCELTKAGKEVLLRELSFLYNIGLQPGTNGAPAMNEPLLNIVGLGDVFGDENVFDPGYSQETEVRLYTLVQMRRTLKWDPIRYEQEEIDNPVKRWLANRGSDTLQAAVLALNLLIPLEPQLDSSWKRQYKHKYKKSLKPLK